MGGIFYIIYFIFQNECLHQQLDLLPNGQAENVHLAVLCVVKDRSVEGEEGREGKGERGRVCVCMLSCVFTHWT